MRERVLVCVATIALSACSPQCGDGRGDGPCASQTFIGTNEGGELGFRFSSPLDMTGDGVNDVAAGARFSEIEGVDQVGIVFAWSGATDDRLLTWEGAESSGLFGHSVITVPDLDGDGLADIVAAAPNRSDGGVVSARSPATGRVLWTATGEGAFGWDFALAGDHDADGVVDLFVGAPATDAARVDLLSGQTGEILRSYPGPAGSETFAFYVAALADLDGDGLRDLFAGAPFHDGAAEDDIGAAFVIASGSGETLLALDGEVPLGRFGEIVSGTSDLDGDGIEDLAVGVPHTNQPGQAGEVLLISFPSGDLIERLVGTEPGEQFGRMVTRVHDVDGDGLDDIAIGAPWYSAGHERERTGRFEVRSAATLEVIASVVGVGEGDWLGWHIAVAERMVDGTRRGLLVSSILTEEEGTPGAGRLELFEL